MGSRATYRRAVHRVGRVKQSPSYVTALLQGNCSLTVFLIEPQWRLDLLQEIRYSFTTEHTGELVEHFLWGARVYNAELVRELCSQISAEKDAAKQLELVAFLRAVLKEDQEEIRTRIIFLARMYPADVVRTTIPPSTNAEQLEE